MIQKMLDSGASPLELSFERVSFYGSKKTILRSILEINSLELGRLTPKQYKVVAGRGKQGGELLARQISKVFESYQMLSDSFGNIECVTVPILSRTLMEGMAASIIFEEFEKNASLSPQKICFELSADLLFEDIGSVKARLSELRDLNVKLAINELGDEFCPIFRLREYAPFDYAIADKYALMGGEDDETLRGLPEIVHMLGAKAIAPEIVEEDKQKIKNAGYDAYSIEDDLIDLTPDEEEVELDEEQ